MRTLNLLILLIICNLLHGCQTISFYHQAISGHLEIMTKRVPIKEIMTSDELDEDKKNLLVATREIRDFASEFLSLPENESYRTFVKLNRPFVSWAVFAAPELSLKLKEWCYPFIGCMPYRGFFNIKDAKKLAQELRKEKLDVTIRGISAYSTLGWFDDPILDTMLNRGEINLAATVFHELTHQKVFVKNDVTFNESLATAIENKGVYMWLEKNYEDKKIADFENWLKTKNIYFDLIRKTRKGLSTLYTSDKSQKIMQAKKKEIFSEFKTKKFTLFQKLKNEKTRDSENLDNNAYLGSIGIYYDLLPEFVDLISYCNNDFQKFFSIVNDLSLEDKEERHKKLKLMEACNKY